AELLVMFPGVPPDALLWDFLDILGNQTAPKSCYIAFSATKIVRNDVILQYHKSEALIEHVGDASSFSGKVQRIHEDYFKKHSLVDSLFDNPPAEIRTTLSSGSGQSGSFKAVYGSSGVAANGVAPAFTAGDVQKVAPGAKAFFELIFTKPVDLEIFNMRMGG
ncbi:unnamed protein product, partial [Polarella glacialis]